MFENVSADLRRLYEGNFTIRALIRGLLTQGFQALLVYRFFRWLRIRGIPGQPFRFIFERFIEITTGISIPAECKIGKGLRIHHFGGIIFHPSVKMGDNCTLYHEVTIGDRGGWGKAANVGDNVLIGAGANAVVTKDIPNNSLAMGNPGKIR